MRRGAYNPEGPVYGRGTLQRRSSLQVLRILSHECSKQGETAHTHQTSSLGNCSSLQRQLLSPARDADSARRPSMTPAVGLCRRSGPALQQSGHQAVATHAAGAASFPAFLCAAYAVPQARTVATFPGGYLIQTALIKARAQYSFSPASTTLRITICPLCLTYII